MRAVGVEDFRQMIEDSNLAEAKGHELASGVEIPKKNYDAFLEYIKKALDEIEPKVEVTVDIRLDIGDVNRNLIDKIKMIDKVSGTGFKSIRAYIDGICDYEIGQMSDYKHLVVKPQPYIYVIKWNFDGDFEEYEEHAMMNDEVSCVVSLDSGFLGRTFVLKLVCDELETE
jgi:single-stranded-DNA-specific exonuclease